MLVNKKKKQLFAELIIFIVTFLWATTFIGVKLALRELPPNLLVAYRFTIALALLIIWKPKLLKSINWKDINEKVMIRILDKQLKILIFSDGKYGDRAIEVVKKKYPKTELILLEEQDPTLFLDEFSLSDEVETAIKNADLLILYLRHPDVVAEICDQKKPTIST